VWDGFPVPGEAPVEAFQPRYTKKLAIPPRTQPMTTSRLRMPQFIPCAIGESD